MLSSLIPEAAIDKLKKSATEQNLTKIKAVCSDLINFPIEPNKFDAIIMVNVLQFLPKEICLNFLTEIKEKIKLGGIILIYWFTVKDPGYKDGLDSKKTFFELELKTIFKDNILFYLKIHYW